MNRIVPIRLKYRWIMDARFAFLLAPIEEISAVTQVPMFCPMMIGIAVLYPTAPVIHSACRIPTDAEELWMTAVSTSPASIPRIGLENIVRILVKCSFSASGATAELIVSIPNIRIAKPTKIFPMSFFLLLSFAVIIITIPIAASTGENDDGFKSCTNRLDP